MQCTAHSLGQHNAALHEHIARRTLHPICWQHIQEASFDTWFQLEVFPKKIKKEKKRRKETDMFCTLQPAYKSNSGLRLPLQQSQHLLAQSVLTGSAQYLSSINLLHVVYSTRPFTLSLKLMASFLSKINFSLHSCTTRVLAFLICTLWKNS